LPENSLHKQIHQLQQKLQQVQSLSNKDQQLLRELDEHIDAVLDPSKPDNSETLQTRLEATLAALEAEYPVLTTAITNAITALSNMGI
jgi:hypothetical protein